MSTVTIQIPDYLKLHIENLVEREGMTLDQFFATAVSEKIAAIEAVDYISSRANRANEDAFQAALSKIPSTPVTADWDKLPPALVSEPESHDAN